MVSSLVSFWGTLSNTRAAIPDRLNGAELGAGGGGWRTDSSAQDSISAQASAEYTAQARLKRL